MQYYGHFALVWVSEEPKQDVTWLTDVEERLPFLTVENAIPTNEKNAH
jgi:hypothetical protein